MARSPTRKWSTIVSTARVAGAIAAIAVMLPACSQGNAAMETGIADPSDTARVSFQMRDDTAMFALNSGVLGGDPSSGCLWLTNSGHRSHIVVEHDHARADFEASPPGVYDGRILLVAIGEEVQMGGGYTNSADPDRRCTVDGTAFLGGLRLGNAHPPG